MTILVLDNSLELTGAFKAALTNILQLRERHRFIFVLQEGSRLGELLDGYGIAWYKIPVRSISRSMMNNLLFPFTTIAGTRALLRIIRKERADAVYQNEVFIITGALARSFARFRLVTHVRVLTRAFPRPLYKLWYGLNRRKSDVLATVSDVCKGEVERLAGPQPRLQVLYDFIIPKERLPPYAMRDQAMHPYKILFIGNYTRGKGQELAIEACRLAVEKLGKHQVALHLYGSDFGYPANVAFRAELAAMARQGGAGIDITLHDFTPDVEAVMKDHDLLLNLSVAESFSFVVAEGMSYGIPVIATRSGGPVELIGADASGVLTDSTPEAVANAIAGLLLFPARRAAMSAAAKERIRELVAARGGIGRFEQLFTGPKAG